MANVPPSQRPSKVIQRPVTQANHPGAVPVELVRPFNDADMQRRAFGSVLVAIAILTLMDAGIKHLAGTFGTPQILVMRYSAGFLVAASFFAVLFALGRVGVPSSKSVWRSFQRAILITIVAGCFFYALSVIPLADATAIAFTAPLYIALLGWLILKEKVGKQTWFAILIGLGGVAVISSGGIGGDVGLDQGLDQRALVGYGAAAIAAFAYGSVLVLTRLHAASDPVPSMIMMQTGFAALLAMPFLGLTIAGIALDGRPFIMPDQGWLWLTLGIGFLGTTGHLLMAYGFKYVPAAKLGPLEYTGLFWAAAYGYFLFAEVPSWRLLAGCALIIVGTWLVMRGERPASAPAN